jgi:16S rRNA processing protein RimM
VHNAETQLLKAGRVMPLGLEGAETANFEIERVRRDPQGFVVKLKGIDDRDAAGSLNSMVWTDERASFARPSAGEFYHIDLVGAEAFDADGQALGRITDVFTTPASDIISVALADTELLVPFVDEYIAGPGPGGQGVRLRNLDALRSPVGA